VIPHLDSNEKHKLNFLIFHLDIYRNVDRSRCKRKQYQCSGNTEWLPSIFVPIISDECDHYIADWLEAFDRGPLTSISFAPSVLSQRSSRRSQSSALNWAHKKADATEGSDTLEMLERDSDVFENEGMRHTSSAP
jgi:hypothetical protein